MGYLKWILTSLTSLGGLGLLALPLSAEAAPSWAPATSFYRSSDALFPSGQVARTALEKSLLRQEQDLSFQMKWNGRVATIPFENGLIDLFTLKSAILKENVVLLSQPLGDAKATATILAGASVEILESRRHWFRVKAGKFEGWMLWNRLAPKNDDPGIYLPVVDTFLRTSPVEGAKILTTLSRGTRLEPLQYTESGWIQVRSKNLVGYVNLQHLAGRADFAAWAWEKGTGWFLVNHREGGFLRSKDGRKVALSKILGFAPLENRLIITRTDDPRRLPLRAHAEVLNLNVTLWGISDLSGHGEVWWKKDLFLLKNGEAETLTTEQLLSRPVFAYALEDKKQIRGLASSAGIWKTEDGKIWRKIPAFGNQDLPVAIHPRGAWLVGTYRSMDLGKSFENSIRWAELAKAIELKTNKTPGRITLRKLDILPSSEIQLQVDTGGRRVSMRSRIDGESWY